jgi:hypothetical protein
MLQTYVEVKRDNAMLEERLLTAEEARRLLRVMTLPRTLPVVKVGRLIRVRQSDLREFLSQNRQVPEPESKQQ